MQDQELYRELDKRWRVTCKSIFGEEVGELSEFEEWLASKKRPLFFAKSSVSGKNVSFIISHEPKNANAISLNEVDLHKKFDPLNINEIKDIDSVIQALGDRVCYTGDIHLGNSRFIEKSTDIVESYYCYDTAQASYSKYIAHCYNLEDSEALFGSINNGGIKYSIAVNTSTNLTRCFEVSMSYASSESLYGHKLFGCTNCLFCFNQHNLRNAVGNLPLSQEKYGEIKAKLVGELTEMLRKNKKLPSLIAIIKGNEPDLSAIKIMPRSAETPTSMDTVEKTFEITSQVLLGKKLKGVEKYENWLKKSTKELEYVKSAVSNDKVLITDHAYNAQLPRDRLVTEREAEELGKLRIDAKELDGITIENAGKRITAVAFFCPEENIGMSANNIKSGINVDSSNFFHNVLSVYSKNGAYNYYAYGSESIFGCNAVRKTQFSMKCYSSAKLTRCLELDSSRDCSDAYFCHNCENVQDALFCFNQKSRRNMIGNTEIEKTKYGELKKKLVGEMADEIEKIGGLDYGILGL